MQTENATEGTHDYLIFKLSDEFYGTPLLNIREVSEYQKPRSVPNSAAHLSGVINIRGEILSVIDLRKKYNYVQKFEKSTVLLVFDIESGPIACVVDSLVSVHEFEEADIDKGKQLSKNFDVGCFIGIGKLKENLVTLIDLKKILELDQVIQSNARRAA